MGGRGASQGIKNRNYLSATSADEADKLGEKVTGNYKLNADSSYALHSYTSQGYRSMNGYLRKQLTDIDIPGDTKYSIEHLSKFLKENKTKEDVLVYRGASISSIPDKFKLNPKGLVGKTIQDKGFMSTTIYNHPAFLTRHVIYKINVPKGTAGTYIAKNSSFQGEKELILDKGTKFKVTKVTETHSGRIEIEGTIVN